MQGPESSPPDFEGKTRRLENWDSVCPPELLNLGSDVVRWGRTDRAHRECRGVPASSRTSMLAIVSSTSLTCVREYHRGGSREI